MAAEESEWFRLPGVFRWSEVCGVFQLGAGWDDEWRFVVKPCSVTSQFEHLYMVHAARASRTFEGRRFLSPGAKIRD